MVGGSDEEGKRDVVNVVSGDRQYRWCFRDVLIIVGGSTGDYFGIWKDALT